MPLKSKFEENGGAKVENDTKDEMNWLISVQLWSHDVRAQRHETSFKFQNKTSQEYFMGVLQFQNFSRKQERIEKQMGVNAISNNNLGYFSNQITIQNQQRKTRWSLVALSIRFSFTKNWFGTSGNTEANKRADES